MKRRWVKFWSDFGPDDETADGSMHYDYFDIDSELAKDPEKLKALAQDEAASHWGYEYLGDGLHYGYKLFPARLSAKARKELANHFLKIEEIHKRNLKHVRSILKSLNA